LQTAVTVSHQSLLLTLRLAGTTGSGLQLGYSVCIRGIYTLPTVQTHISHSFYSSQKKKSNHLTLSFTLTWFVMEPGPIPSPALVLWSIP
jgi:hypothetical protein